MSFSFVVKENKDNPEEEEFAVVTIKVGYDKQTGRLVRKEIQEYGIYGEETSAKMTVHELVEDG